MKNTTKIILGFVALVVLIVAGYELTHESLVSAISPAGTTNTSAKAPSISFSLTSSSGTTTSEFNNSGYDYAIKADDIMCQGLGSSKTAYTGTGLAALKIQAATSSTNNTSVNVGDINTNYAINTIVGTSTVDSYISSSTEGVIPGTSRIWPNQTYLIISANATNTGACTLGTPVLPL